MIYLIWNIDLWNRLNLVKAKHLYFKVKWFTLLELHQVLGWLLLNCLLSKVRACRLINVSQSVYRYQSCRRDESGLKERLLTLAKQYPRYSYHTLHAILKCEGLVVNSKKTYRLYWERRLTSEDKTA